MTTNSKAFLYSDSWKLSAFGAKLLGKSEHTKCTGW